MQASVLDLYDPDRAQTVTLAGLTSTWGDFHNALRLKLEPKQGDGRGVRLLTGNVTSPTFAAQLAEFQKLFPGAVRHQHEPAHRLNSDEGARLAFGSPLNLIHDFSQASVIFSLGCDFVFEEPLSLRYARQFIDGRRVRKSNLKMNRLYVVEPTLTMTGSMADHRLPLSNVAIHAVASAVANALGVTGAAGPALPPNLQSWVSALVEDLKHPEGGGNSLLVAGESQPPAVHLLVHAINEALGNFGKTVTVVNSPAIPERRRCNN